MPTLPEGRARIICRSGPKGVIKWKVNVMEKEKNNDFFGEFEFNYAVVIFGKLSDLERIRNLLEKEPGVTIRYQTIDRGRLLIKKEGINDK